MSVKFMHKEQHFFKFVLDQCRMLKTKKTKAVTVKVTTSL